jgi:hypothetical protein
MPPEGTPGMLPGRHKYATKKRWLVLLEEAIKIASKDLFYKVHSQDIILRHLVNNTCRLKKINSDH